MPENYDLPAFGTVEENARLQLQAARIGDVLLGSCACEAQVDLILNFESRANDVVGDIWDGYPWDEHCTQQADLSWKCANPDAADLDTDRSLAVTDAAYQRMKAQIHNDAAGWDDPEYAPYANSEPADPEAIKGNFTKEELDASTGFALVVGLGHTGDYNGYTVSYREYMNRESYRKALTSYGAHTADYMVTRLVRMAAALKTGTAFVPTDTLGPVAAGRRGTPGGGLDGARRRVRRWRTTPGWPRSPRTPARPRRSVSRRRSPASRRPRSSGGAARTPSTTPRCAWNASRARRGCPSPTRAARCRRWSSSRRGSRVSPRPTPACRSGSGRRTSRRSTPHPPTRPDPGGHVPLRRRRPHPQGRCDRAVSPRVRPDSRSRPGTASRSAT